MTNPFTGETVGENELEVVKGAGVTLDGLKNPEMLMFCTFKPETKKDKIFLYNAVQTPNARIKECVNMEIAVVHVYAEIATLSDGSKVPRIILIDKDGKAYQSTAFGVYHSLEKIMNIVGQPPYDAKDPLIVIPKLITTKKGQTLTLTIK